MMDKIELAKCRIAKSYKKPDYFAASFGIQAQHITSAGLSLAIRNNKLNSTTYADMIENLSAIRLWGQRNTLHIYHPDDLSFVYGLNKFLGNWFRTKWKKTDLKTYDESIKAALNVCRSRETITREDLLMAGVDSRLIDNWGGIFIDLFSYGVLFPACKNMKTVFTNSQELPPFSESSIDESLRHIVKKYFVQYGPATESDFAHWLGVSPKVALNILNKYGCDLVCDDSFWFTKAESSKDFDSIKDEYLLTAKFDNLYLAYAKKDWIIDPQYIKSLWIKSGIIEASIIHDCKTIGVWRYKIKKGTIDVSVVLFDENQDKHAISTAIIDFLQRFWHKECFVQYKADFNDAE